MIRRLYYRWRLRVWERRLTHRIIDLKSQEEHPTGGEAISTSTGITDYTKKLKDRVIRANQQMMRYRTRINLDTTDEIKAVPIAMALKEKNHE